MLSHAQIHFPNNLVCFYFWRFYFFTFHESRYFTCFIPSSFFSFLLFHFYFFTCLLFMGPDIYLFTCLLLYCFTLLGFCYFTTKIEQSSCFLGCCSSFYRNMHFVQVKCMFLELCAHCINGTHVHVCVFFLQFVMHNLPVC